MLSANTVYKRLLGVPTVLTLVATAISQGDAPQYDASRTFSLFPRRHELGEVLRILKRLGQAVLE